MTRAEDGASAAQTDHCLLLQLPSHLLREVFGFLDAKDVARAATTCSTFRQVSRSESLWRALLADKLGTQAEIVLPTSLPDERCECQRRARALFILFGRFGHRRYELFSWPRKIFSVMLCQTAQLNHPNGAYLQVPQRSGES